MKSNPGMDKVVCFYFGDIVFHIFLCWVNHAEFLNMCLACWRLGIQFPTLQKCCEIWRKGSLALILAWLVTSHSHLILKIILILSYKNWEQRW
jgi:hypothetical protein